MNHTHAPAQLPVDAVMRDGVADHWRESYVGESGQVNESRGVDRSSKGLLVKNRVGVEKVTELVLARATTATL